MSLKTITLTLARDPEAPEGREDCGYEFVAPLSADGHIDLAGWHKHRAQCGSGGSGRARTMSRAT